MTLCKHENNLLLTVRLDLLFRRFCGEGCVGGRLRGHKIRKAPTSFIRSYLPYGTQDDRSTNVVLWRFHSQGREIKVHRQ